MLQYAVVVHSNRFLFYPIFREKHFPTKNLGDLPKRVSTHLADYIKMFVAIYSQLENCGPIIKRAVTHKLGR